MFWKRRSSLVLLSLTSLSSLSLAAVAQKIGPSPYLSFADSPFAATNFSSGYFYLENFESGILQTPGVTATGGSVYGPAFNADSVDADDGVIDGAGTNGHAYLGDGVTGIHFNFSASTLGALPTHVGIVWTDGSTFNDVTFEAFDASNNSLGAIVGNNLGGRQLQRRDGRRSIFWPDFQPGNLFYLHYFSAKCRGPGQRH